MKIYIVSEVDWDYKEILEAFVSERAAELYAEARDAECHYSYTVEELELNE